MNHTRLRTLCLFTVVCACFSGCVPSSGTITEPMEQFAPAQAGEAEKSCLEFVQRELTFQGGVYTNYLCEETPGDLASGHEVLSESQGLMLRYYAASSNREWYESTLAFIQQKLDSGTLISYRLREDGSRFPVNASVDDLRILRGLLEGAQVFSEPDYLALSDQYAERLYGTNVDRNLLLDFYDEFYTLAGRLCTLCYSDLKTMQMLGARDSRWLKVEDTMRRIVLGGYMEDDFPFFRMYYQPDTDSYASENIRMAETLLTAVHLSEVGECPAETVRWLKAALANGCIYGEYTVLGEPVNRIESTAVYALCVLLGVSENDPELVRAAADKLYTFQIAEKQNELYGAFADAAAGQAYSFDNLTALAALREQAGFFSANEKGDAD